jgi:hypothetical protein
MQSSISYMLYTLVSSILISVMYGIGLPVNIPLDIASTIRRELVTSPHMWVYEAPVRCNSMSSGPSCSFLGDSEAIPVMGIIHPSIWNMEYGRPYMHTQHYIYDHFKRGSRQRRHLAKTTQMLPLEETALRLEPHDIAMDASGWSPSLNGLMQLNTNYGYFAWVLHQVSMVDFTIFASGDYNVLVRGYHDGVPRWTRMVSAGTELNVARVSSTVDPSLVAVDYIEVIGMGAVVRKMEVSFASAYMHEQEVFYFNQNLSKHNNHKFPPSAHLLDLETIVLEGLKPIESSRIVYIPDARDDRVFGYERFMDLCTSPGMDFPTKYADYFVQSLEITFAKGGDKDFLRVFTDRLLESSPELLSYVLKGGAERTVSDSPLTGASVGDYQEKAAHNDRIRALLTQEKNAENVWSELAKVVSTHDQIGHLDFAISPHVINVASRVVVSLITLIGEEKFKDFIVAKKVQRIVNQMPVNLGLDETMLRDILVAAFSLELSDATPRADRVDMISSALSQLIDDPSSVSELAQALAQPGV